MSIKFEPTSNHDDSAEIYPPVKALDGTEPLVTQVGLSGADTGNFPVQDFVAYAASGQPPGYARQRFPSPELGNGVGLGLDPAWSGYRSGYQSSESIDCLVIRIVKATLKACEAMIKKEIDFQLGAKCEAWFSEQLTQQKEESTAQFQHNHKSQLNEIHVQAPEKKQDEELDANAFQDGEAKQERRCRDHEIPSHLRSGIDTTISDTVADICKELVPGIIASLRVEQYERVQEEARQEFRAAQAHRARISIFNDEVLARARANRVNKAGQEAERAALSPRIRTLRASERLNLCLEDRFPNRPEMKPETSTSVYEDGLSGFFPPNRAVPDAPEDSSLPTQASYTGMEETLLSNATTRQDELFSDQPTTSQTNKALSPKVGSKRAYPIATGPLGGGHCTEENNTIARIPDKKRRRVEHEGPSTRTQARMKRADLLKIEKEEAKECERAGASDASVEKSNVKIAAPTERAKERGMTNINCGSILAGMRKSQLKRAHDAGQEVTDEALASPSAKRQRYASPGDKASSATNVKKPTSIGPRTIAGARKPTRKRTAALPLSESKQIFSAPQNHGHYAHKKDTEDELASPDIKEEGE
ncbi:MAG: hypothetical protein Q9220_004216 [cf. Caloplaca sp. 1 TL-2023]